MGAINSRETNPIPGVAFSEIMIPDEYNLGTGIFTTVVEAEALKKMSPIISNVLNEPYFLMIVTINLGIDQVTVLIGKAHDEGAIDRKVFNIPKDIAVEVAGRSSSLSSMPCAQIACLPMVLTDPRHRTSRRWRTKALF